MILNMYVDGRLDGAGRSTLCLTTSGSAGLSLALMQQALEECGAELNAIIVLPKAYRNKATAQRIMAMGVPVFEDAPGDVKGPQMLLLDGTFMEVLAEAKELSERQGWEVLDQHHDNNSMGAHHLTGTSTTTMVHAQAWGTQTPRKEAMQDRRRSKHQSCGT